MQIHTHSPSRPWEQGLSSPPPKTRDQPTGQREPVDHFKATSKEKSHFSLVGTGLLALTALTGMVAAKPAAAQVLEIKTLPSQEVTPNCIRQEGTYENPDDWKEELPGGSHHCAALPRPGLNQGFEGILHFQGPEDWKAGLGGGDYNPGPSPAKTSNRGHDTQPSQKSERYEGPDSWKEEIGSGSYNYDSGSDSGSSQSDDWGGPDDWKSGI